MYLLFLFITGIVVLVTMIKAWNLSSDPLHPALLFAVPLAGLYVGQPLLLTLRDQAELLRYLSEDRLLFVTLLNFAGVVAICLGVVGPRGQTPVHSRMAFANNFKGLRRIGILMGAIAVSSYIYCIYQVGGLYSAYGQSYGGGWSDLGYVREAYWLGVPAVTLIAISRKRLRYRDYLLAGLFASPMLFHGLLGGRRGPTAAGLLTLVLSRWLSTGKRPAPLNFLAGMACLGLLLLVIVANRENIQLGSEIKLDEGVESYATSVGSSNEFVYGGAVMYASWWQEMHYYGRRYLTVIFIRPVPSQIWPGKYAFASEQLGIPNLAKKGSNLGTGNLSFNRALGWVPAVGAAPGLVADLFLEFSYFYVLVLWLIGRFYWFGWHRAMLGNRFWGIAYIVMAVLSIYLIMQTLEAMLFRFLLAAGFVCFTWVVVEGRLPRFQWRLRRRARQPQRRPPHMERPR